ncbi:tRNA methyltransferase [Candidatus Pacearchaeota archaeon CG10_big_fil_rev_8_21_14_0_10_32_42]|nr:MAG: tRNA methyltransferase [Candidatus Pacearchaeota archaeon CG10_big_fil_rev_8_21_14_0_10_32_42]
MRERKIPEPKPLFIERMKKLLSEKEDRENYWEISKSEPLNSIRVNTLKIEPEILKEKLEKMGWKLAQPWEKFPEILIVEGKIPTGKEKEILVETNLAKLEPGELGRTLEHLLGYYYIQELSSMLPVIALNPKEGEFYLDVCASPGSKTTQAGTFMNNAGTIIANEISLGRMRILASNLERCGVTNTILTKKDGRDLCKKFIEKNFMFDKILVDAPCSGEGTLRSSPKTYIMWNQKTIQSLSKLQKQLVKNAFLSLKIDGELVYSTCTHAPEENEEVVDFLLNEFKEKIEIVKFKLPLKTREGLTEWNEKKFSEKVKLTKRIYPQDNNTEGFFVAKFRRVK